MALTEYSSASGSRRGLASLAGRDVNRTVVLLRGVYDASTVTALSEAIARAIALDDAALVLDLSGVEFMDAATVRLIIRARRVPPAAIAVVDAAIALDARPARPRSVWPR